MIRACPFLTLLLAACLALPSQAQQTPWDVAITLDDIPMTGGANCDRADIVPVNDAILALLAERRIVAAGFFTMGTPCQGEGERSAIELARRWRQAGHEVANHSFTHRDFNALSVEDYLADAQRAHAALAPVLLETGQAERWFRPPYLHAGPDNARRAALEHWLEQNGVGMGVVTIDNQEWVYAAAYDRARARGDAALAQAVADAYVEHIVASSEYYRSIARTHFGREIAHVLLLHANRLNADHMDRALQALAPTGARFVPFSQAVADPVYESADNYIGPRGLSWVLRWTLGQDHPPEPREAAWVAYAAQDTTMVSGDVDRQLAAANEAFSRAWLAGDAEALANSYTRDAVVHPSAGGVLATPDAVADFWRRFTQRDGRVGHRVEPTLRRELASGLVLETGRWHAAHAAYGSDWQSGCYTLVWRREADAWRMVYDAWTDANEASWACRPR